MTSNNHIFFTYLQIKPDLIRIFYYNGVCVGDFIKNDDGYFVFFPEERGGYWESWGMKIIADKMDELNKEWDEVIDKEFEKNDEED